MALKAHLGANCAPSETEQIDLADGQTLYEVEARCTGKSTQCRLMHKASP